MCGEWGTQMLCERGAIRAPRVGGWGDPVGECGACF